MGRNACSVRQYFCTIAAAVLQYSLDTHVSASHKLDATSDKFDTKSFLRAALFGDVMEKNEMGGACSTYGGGEVYRFSGQNLSERYRLGDLGVDGRIMVRWMFRK